MSKKTCNFVAKFVVTIFSHLTKETTMTESDIKQQEEEVIEHEFQALLDDYAHTLHRQKVEIITKAFQFAKQAHKGVRRRSGEPYIMHPLAVARIVVKDIGLGSTSICAALLHDVVEDTNYTTEDISDMFGPKIASIVDGLTKISGGVFGEQASLQAENFRKLLLTMSEDIRVILIKIADRLHNMRTLEFQPVEKRYKIAGETQYIYAPLAHRLGLFPIKSELENLSFRFEHPEVYKQIEDKLNANVNAEMESFEEFAKPIREKLSDMGYEFQLEARIKSVYSIWKKMQAKQIPFEEVFDLLAVRIIFEPNADRGEKDQCWMIYSALTEIYKPHPGRIRDWISTPKANGYEALHVTVMGQNGQWVEVQIRTTRMHEIAEKGLAAHWKYKTGFEDDNSELDKWVSEIKDMLSHPEQNAMDFLDAFKLNLFASEIFVFTPRGDIKTLPLGATALDFAYMLHSELGNHCIGAKVNHKLVPLSYVLKGGDQVEVLTSNTQEPKTEWLEWVTTAKSRSCIKDVFKNKEKALRERGKQILLDKLQQLNKANSYEIAINRMLRYYNLTQQSQLLLQIGCEALKVDILEDLLKDEKKSWWQRMLPFGNSTQHSQSEDHPQEDKSSITTTSKAKIKHIVLTEENEGTEYKIASCCHPIPGDEILGYRELDGIITIHKRECPIANRLKSSYGKRFLTASWATHRINTFIETIEIHGIDTAGVIIQVMNILSKQFQINLHSINIIANDGIFTGTIELYVYDTEEIDRICKEIQKIDAIDYVHRIETQQQ